LEVDEERCREIPDIGRDFSACAETQGPPERIDLLLNRRAWSDRVLVVEDPSAHRANGPAREAVLPLIIGGKIQAVGSDYTGIVATGIDQGDGGSRAWRRSKNYPRYRVEGGSGRLCGTVHQRAEQIV